MVAARGRLEIDFSVEPPILTTVYSRPESESHQQTAKLAHQAALAKVREIIPKDIVLSPA
jgi:hypothetical protein